MPAQKEHNETRDFSPFCGRRCTPPGLVDAQDVMQAAPDHYKVKVENSHVRVFENILKPGERDAQHTHPAGWYYVTQGGSMRVTYGCDGRSGDRNPCSAEVTNKQRLSQTGKTPAAA
jgi:hypothetical protein